VNQSVHDRDENHELQHDQVRASTIVGVDTHKETHVAVAIDALGQRLGEQTFSADSAGYSALTLWADSWGKVSRYGVEGTGCYGAGLARHLRTTGQRVIEIDRPDRRARRRGKSDSIDAEADARSVLAGVATTEPKTAEQRRRDAPGPQDRQGLGGAGPHAGRQPAQSRWSSPHTTT